MSLNYFRFFLYAIFIAIITFRLVTSELSSLNNLVFIAFATLFIPSFTINKKAWDLSFLYAILLLLLVLNYTFSILAGSDLFQATKTLIVLSLLPFAFFLFKSNRVEYAYILILVGLIQSLFLIGFEYYMVSNFNELNYGEIRTYIVDSGIGDIYTRNGFFWNIQFAGNAVVFVSFLLTFFLVDRKIFFYPIIGVLGAGIVVSGHSWYYISTFLFLVWYYANNKIKHFIHRQLFYATIFLFGIALVFIIFGDVSMEQVKLKADYSWPVRVDQFNVLINDLFRSPFNALFGNGLGHVVNVSTSYRNYADSYYFELQSLYVLNQIGVLPFLLLIFIHFKSAKDTISKPLLYSYCFYFFSGILNPYLFDSAHVAFTIGFISTNYKYIKTQYEKSTASYLI